MAPANLAAARGWRRLCFWTVKHKVETLKWCSNRDVTECEKDTHRGKCERERRKKERDAHRGKIPVAYTHCSPSFFHRDFPRERGIPPQSRNETCVTSRKHTLNTYVWVRQRENQNFFLARKMKFFLFCSSFLRLPRIFLHENSQKMHRN